MPSRATRATFPGSRAWIVRIFTVGGAVFTATAAWTQVMPDAGSTLRQLEPPVLTLPRKPRPPVEVETPERPALQPAPAIRFTLNGFRIKGVTVFAESELQSLVQDLVGREVGIQELGEVVGRITRLYVERGYPLATAYLPVQNIEGGVVEIVVLEGRYGSVNLLNRSLVGDAVVASYLEGLRGRIVEEAGLERKLLLIYDLPGVVPDKAVLSPGQAVGETDLRVELQPGRRAAALVEVDNHGGRFAGAIRVSGQMDLASPLGIGDGLSVRATKGDPDLEYVRVAYQVSIPGDGLQTGGAYSSVRYRLGKDFAALGAHGEADAVSLFAMYPIIRSRQANLYGRLGYEHRSLRDHIDTASVVSDRGLDVMGLALSGNFFDALGAGGANAFSLAYNSGRLRIETPTAKAIDDASARTHGTYDRWNLGYVRLQNLTDRTTFFVSFSGQKASKNLDSSEKLILGGINGVRAYPQGEAPADSGYLLTGELRYAFTVGGLPGALQLAGFLDTGLATINEEPFFAAPNRRRLSGGGVSLNWSRVNDFVLRVVVAHRIGNERATAGTDAHTRAWLQAIKNF